MLAIFCNVLIYIAVEGYRSIENSLGRYLAVFFGVTVFVVCGFEHCVANMYYFTAAGAWFGCFRARRSVLCITPMSTQLGNAAGRACW